MTLPEARLVGARRRWNVGVLAIWVGYGLLLAVAGLLVGVLPDAAIAWVVGIGVLVAMFTPWAGVRSVDVNRPREDTRDPVPPAHR